MTTPLAPRRAALELFEAVIRKRRPLDEAWQDALERRDGLASCDRRDRAFVRRLVATALRRLGQIDAVIGCFLDRPLPAKRARAHDILRLGATQLLFLDTPAHAAVDGSVVMAAQDRSPGIRGLKGLVNAVLRRVAEQGPALLATRVADIGINVPGWLAQSWNAAYGAEATAAIMVQHMKEPPLDFTLKPGADPHQWAERLDAGILPTGSLRRKTGGRIETLAGYDDGVWWIQDAAAALPARLFGDISGRRVIDLCSAPGGKTAQLAAQGAIVTAVDRSARRLERVGRNLARLGLDAEQVAADVTTWRPGEPVDFIMLDAPCTATGTMRRHPDIAHLRTPEDVASVSRLQRRMIRSALDMLTPGGVLIYCTCSLQPEEGPQAIAAALSETGLAEQLPIRPDELEGIESFITGDGDLRTLPSHWTDRGGLDGFFVARLRKTG
ncbi:MAG: RsmB/NOP family class I SAM-dependent RNA methyltransferase [Sphingomonadales bacterium]